MIGVIYMEEYEDFGEIQRKYVMQCWARQKEYRPIPVVKVEGCWLYTKDGRKIFDLRSAHESINLGFRHPKVLDAIRKQLEKVIYVTDDFATWPTAMLAKKLAEISPGDKDKKVWFCQSGAAAVEAAIKASRFCRYNELFRSNRNPAQVTDWNYPYPHKIISRYRSYHGATHGAVSVSGDPRRWCIEPIKMPGVVYAPDPYCYRCPFGLEYPDCDIQCAQYVDYMVEWEGGSTKVAAVIVEPVVGSNGIIPPPPEYFKILREICDKWDIILICDEIMSGFGRTGKMFAIEHYGIVPDIITMAKSFGVYVPLGATIFSKRVSESFEENLFCHGQSFSGHALACAAAMAGIEVLEEEKILEHVQKTGKYLGKRLRELQDNHPSVGDVRGLGFFWTLELVKDRETKEPFRRPSEKYVSSVITKIANYLLEKRNIYIPSDKWIIWIVPPLIATKEELDFVVDAIDDALKISDGEVQKR